VIRDEEALSRAFPGEKGNHQDPLGEILAEIAIQI
jgi:hypothetical protein